MEPHPFGWLSILPPLVAIVMAIVTRQIILSLLAGIWIGWLIVASFNPLVGTRDAVACLIDVFSEPWRTTTLVFTLIVGSLLILMQRSGGVEGFVAWVSRWTWAHSRRGAQLMAWIIGLGVFIESIITCLVVGTAARPLFDRLKISREKLAYICDATSAPVCILIPINGWGAMVLGLLAAEAASGHLGDRGPLSIFVASIPLNIYAITSVLLVLFVVLTGWDIGPMRKAERRARVEGKVLRDGAMPVVDTDVITTTPKEGVTPQMRHMLFPVLAMVLMVPAGIVITGLPAVREAGQSLGTVEGFMTLLDNASGATSVLWGVSLACATAFGLAVTHRLLSVDEAVQTALKGAGGLIPLAVIMLLAFAIGMTCDKLETGTFVAQKAAPYLTVEAIAPVVFVVAGIMAFSTGTSWGTFAIMIPLAVPLVAEFQKQGDPVSLPLVVSAVLGGGVFGDHCSPISDTTVVSSMASCSDHIDHVRTQLPYALIAATISVSLYWYLGRP